MNYIKALTINDIYQHIGHYLCATGIKNTIARLDLVQQRFTWYGDSSDMLTYKNNFQETDR